MKDFIRIPIYSNNLLKEYFRYGNEFQIYPFKSTFQDIPEDATVKPMLLEISFEKSKYELNSKGVNNVVNDLNIDVETLNKLTPAYNKTTTILRLLTIFTNFKFFHYSTKKAWHLNEVKGKSVWGIRSFLYSDFEREYPRNITSLTEGLSFEKIQEIPFSEYFINPKLDSSQTIIFHSEMHNLFNKYFGLEERKRKKVDAICSLFSKGIRLFDSSKSLSFVAFTSCIEAFTSIEYAAENKKIKYSCKSCKKVIDSDYKCDCGEPVWGISYKFKKFLSTYVSDSISSKAEFNKIYSLRSKIVHDGELFVADSLFDWSNDDKAEEEWKLLSTMQQVTRIAIINWLLNSPFASNS